jgi:FtsZ-interacting cell division protein ZipA
MRERQRPGPSGLAVIGGTAAVGLCMLALASAPAHAFAVAVAPEPSRQTAGESEAPANVKPDPPPQATERMSLRSPRESTQSGNSLNPPTGASQPAGAPSRPVVTSTSPGEAAPAPASVAATAPVTAPAPARAAATQRSHTPRGLERAQVGRAPVRAHHHARSAVVGATVLSPATSDRSGLRLLLASLASGLLMVSGLALLRLLKRLDATPHVGSRP